MLRFLFAFAFFSILFFGCKTADSPQSPTTTAATEKAEITTETTSTGSSLDKEEQHKFDALIKQGDSNYKSGNYREALNFYKTAQAMAPDQLGNEKLIACLKALQEPSTRNKSSH